MARLIVVAAGACAFGMAGLVASYETALHLTRQRVLSALHQAGWTGNVSADPLMGTVSIDALAARQGSYSIRIGNLRLSNPPTFSIVSQAYAAEENEAVEAIKKALLSPEPPAQAKVGAGVLEPSHAGNGTAIASDIVIEDGDTTYHVARIELAGTTLTDDDLAALLKPGTSDTIGQRLRPVKATAITVKGVVIDQKRADGSLKIEVPDVLMADVNAGRAALASAGSLKATQVGKEGRLTVGAMQATGIDFAQIAVTLESKRSEADTELHALADSLALNGIAMADKGDTPDVTLSVLKLQNVKGRALRDGLINVAGWTKPSKDDQTRVSLDAVASFSVGSAELDGFANVDTKDKPTGDVATMSISQLIVRGIANGGVSRLDLQGFHLDSHEARLGLEKLTATSFASGLVTKSDGNLDWSPTLGGMSATGIAADVDVADKGKPESRAVFKVADIGYAASFAPPSKLPLTSDIKVEHVTFDIPPGDSSLKPLADLGYKHLDVSSKLASSYDPTNQTLRLDGFQVSDPEMGQADFGLELGNVSDKIVSPNQELAKAASLAMLLKKVSLSLRNGNLVDRIFEQRAQKDGRTVDDERKLTAVLVTDQLPQMIGDPPQLKPLEHAVADFLQRPHTLHVSVTTPDGLGAADIGLLNDPNALLSKLKIEASANQ